MKHLYALSLWGLLALGATICRPVRWGLTLAALLLLGTAPARAQSYYLPTPGTIVTCSGTLYATMGFGTYVVPNSNNVRTIRPATANSQVTLSFNYFDLRPNVDMSGNRDLVRVYNGPSTASPVLFELTGSASATAVVPLLVRASNPTGELTVQLIFAAATAGTNQGFSANIACVPSFLISVPGDIAACPGGQLTDSGGSQANYQDRESFTRVIAPDATTNRVRLAFSSFNTEANYDFLRIYDGPNTSAPLLGTYSGSTSPGTVYATNPTGKLTVRFTSDDSVPGAGFVAAVSCVAAPTISSFSPTGGRPADVVIIRGTNLGGTTAVRFNGLNAPAFTVNSATQVTATVPAGASSGLISVSTSANGTASSSTAFVVPVAAVTSFSPVSGPAGTLVTLTGTELTGATAVRFGGVNAPTFTVNSNTQITVTVPTGAPQAPISVTTPLLGTVTSAASFNVGAQAYLISGAGGISACSGTLYDSGGPAGAYGPNLNFTRTLSPATAGNKVQLRFSVFDTYSYTSPFDPEEVDYVRIYDGASTGAPLLAEFYGNANAGFGNRINLPAGAVTATNAAGQLTVAFTSGPADFNGIAHAGFAADILCVATPVISSFAPATGPAGTTVVITGTGLTDASNVRFNGVSATNFTVNSPTQATASVPAGATTGPISLTTPLGTGTSAGTFTVLQPPVISSFAPGTGAGGAVVTITGNHFTNASSVTFNGVNAPTFTVNSATQMTVTVPLLATSGRIKVVTPIGAATSATDFTVAAPTISGFSPGNGTAGTVVTVNGTGFSTATAVTFNGVSAAFTVVSAAQVTATVPTTASTGLIRVLTLNGTASSATSFVVAAPVISSFTPGTGPAGTVVTVNGTGLLATTAVAFNGVAAVFTVVSATQLTATVPNAATTGLISLSAPNGTASSGSSFAVAPPTIGSFSPGTGPVSTLVTLNGTGLLATTAVTFNGVSAAFTVVSAAQVTATVPATATTGPIALSTPAGTATTPTFAVPPPTTISGFTPGTGPAGTVVTVNGSGFGAGTTVAFNGVNAPAVTINSTAQLTVTVPLAATTGPISVASPSNGPASSSNFVVPPPVISSFSPAGGPAGTVVTLTGSGLLAATTVRFGGIAAASFTVVSATQITVTVPAQALTGPITVEAPSGTGTSSAPFDSGNFLISTAGGITACAGTLFDSGGPNGYYQPAEDYVRTISPGDPAKKVQLTVTAFDLYADIFGNDDILEVYDGASTSAPLLARYRQRFSALPTGSLTASNAAGQLTVRFRSMNSSAPGFAATIACVVPPVISSFSPGAGPGGTVVVITGTGFSGATAVAFQGTAVNSYTVNSATQITTTVPQFAATGPIAVTGANAAIAYSATPFDTGKHLISTAGSLTTCSGAIYDPSGPDGEYNSGENYTRTLYPGTAGGRVRLTFTEFEVDDFYGTDRLTIYNGPDTNAPVLGTFTGFALPGAVTATNPTGALTLRFQSGNIARSTFTGFAATIACVPGPTISDFTPKSGTVGTVVSLTGTNLTGATAITFTGSSGNVVSSGFTVVNATSITGIVVPAGATTGPLIVTTALGPSLPSSQIFVLPPTLSAVSPAAELPGTTVTLTGTNFGVGTSVKFNNVSGTNVSVLSATSLTVTVPAGLAAGSAPVVITAAGFNSGSIPFTVLGVYSGGTVGTCAPAVPPTASLNDGQWHYLLSAGQVVAAYKYSGASLGNLALEVLRADLALAVRRDGGGRPYLDRNFHLTASSGRFDGRTVNLRLYGLNTEFARLQAADPAVTLAQLKATQYSGTNEDCTLANNVAAGERRVLPAPATSPAGAPWFAAEMTVADHFSEFYLTGASAPLPVELTAFIATADGNRAVRLAWATASEKNSAAFDVERSLDGRTFAPIGTVAAAGNSSAPRAYGLTDAQLPTLDRLLYYRLRQVDVDGTFNYSPVRSVLLRGGTVSAAPLVLAPNPARLSTLSGAEAYAAVQVFDVLGRPVLTAQADAAGTARLTLPTTVPAGVYLVRSGTHATRWVVE